jgi:F-type H+-transporting ATPase subunit delta
LIGSKISRRYAKALLSLGREDGNYEVYGQNLQEFSGFCQANQEFFRVVSNRIFPLDDRKKVLETVLEQSGFSSVVQNFLKLLLDKNRIGAIEEITDYYMKLTDEISGVTRANIITARALREESIVKLQEVLSGLTSKTVNVDIQEDASLIGGIIVQLGDLVLDGSVKAQLAGLKDSLKRGG